jgi:hypothetical protein
MKTILFALLFAAPVFAQSLTSACGPENAKFSVTLDNSHASLPKAEPGKVMVVFIQDFGARAFGLGVHPTSRIGIDGSWAGALKDNSYLSVSVEPGEHHICANLDSELLGNPFELAHFTAEAGNVYYFRWRYLSGGNLFLTTADSDEAEHLISKYPLSVLKQKK